MRRIILHVVAIALLVGGIGVLYWEFFGGAEVVRKLPVTAGAFCVFLGGYLLWDETFSPRE